MIVFRQISWEQFGTGIGAALLLYYAAVGWYYYKSELLALLGKLQQGKPEETEAENAPPVIIGTSKAEEGISEVSSEELVFAAPEREETVPAQVPEKKLANKTNQLLSRVIREQEQASLIGDVADTMEEIKTLLDMAKESGENKKKLLDTLQLLAPKLQALSGTTYPDALKLYLLDEIHKRFAFEISKAELEKLWQTPKKKKGLSAVIALGFMLFALSARSQDGSAGINQATSMVKGYFDAGCNLMYAIGAVIAIIGAVKTFQKFNAGEGDTGKVAAAWFGSCIFLVVVATVIKSFFGL